MILIYTHKTNERLLYTFDLVLSTVLGLEFKVITDKMEFQAYSGPKLSYCYRAIADELHFTAVNLLFEKGIGEQEIKVEEIDGLPVFFQVKDNPNLAFDIFALSFYLAVRYEEYLPHIRDNYDRYDPKESIAVQHEFIKKPLINLWAERLKKILLNRFPELHFEKRKYRYIPTLDIDNAFAYRQKGVVRTVGASLKLLFQLNIKGLVEQLMVVVGLRHDPFDTFEYQNLVHRRFGINPIYFFLVADYGLNDKNIPIESRSFRSLIKSIADIATVGIHPGFCSNEKREKLEQELNRLEDIIKKEITQSRQHFLKLNLPETYRNLINLDIKEDYTMGYASKVGFRASICVPYYFYDLDLEKVTDLKLFPFAIMDAGLKFYNNRSVEEAREEIKSMVDAVRAVNGTFISLWHNESLSNQGVWEGWKELYEFLLETASIKS